MVLDVLQATLQMFEKRLTLWHIVCSKRRIMRFIFVQAQIKVLDGFYQPHLFSSKLWGPCFLSEACKIFSEWAKNSSKRHPPPPLLLEDSGKLSQSICASFVPEVPLKPGLHSTHAYWVPVSCQILFKVLGHCASWLTFSQGLHSSRWWQGRGSYKRSKVILW